MRAITLSSWSWFILSKDRIRFNVAW